MTVEMTQGATDFYDADEIQEMEIARNAMQDDPTTPAEYLEMAARILFDSTDAFAFKALDADATATWNIWTQPDAIAPGSGKADISIKGLVRMCLPDYKASYAQVYAPITSIWRGVTDDMFCMLFRQTGRGYLDAEDLENMRLD